MDFFTVSSISLLPIPTGSAFRIPSLPLLTYAEHLVPLRGFQLPLAYRHLGATAGDLTSAFEDRDTGIVLSL